MLCPHLLNKTLIAPLRNAMYNFEEMSVRHALQSTFSQDAKIQLCHPFENMACIEDLYDRAYAPLYEAIPDLERRDTLLMSGPSEDGSHWVGCCGYYTGSFEKPWLGIVPTGHQVSMRFHEFYKIEDHQIIEMQALWDIPEVMMQANCWPMSPSLGREWHVPAPAPQNGLSQIPWDAASSQSSYQTVLDMCNALGNHAEGGVEAMELGRYWHERCSWYGPSGIGTARGIKGFRNWHQIPFLNGLPDRVGDASKGYLFADGDFVGFTAWPGMSMSVSGDGWLGIAPSGQEITMRSLDFWRCENQMIRENWVLVDLLHVYHQLGVNVLHRMSEMTKARRLQFDP
ncbi:ester cyclase [Temperatibacter marinus]|uniref:Ester cyclase n=1 Tax=Temperatibacter marinus TaxID=1456591 RepID=A0AA52EJ74_9PROT|nr:ester cyclase [Temperatibacter marinus]WND03026.1 ester cyclase [Temperatibacter marinus]